MKYTPRFTYTPDRVEYCDHPAARVDGIAVSLTESDPRAYGTHRVVGTRVVCDDCFERMLDEADREW